MFEQRIIDALKEIGTPSKEFISYIHKQRDGYREQMNTRADFEFKFSIAVKGSPEHDNLLKEFVEFLKTEIYVEKLFFKFGVCKFTVHLVDETATLTIPTPPAWFDPKRHVFDIYTGIVTELPMPSPITTDWYL